MRSNAVQVTSAMGLGLRQQEVLRKEVGKGNPRCVEGQDEAIASAGSPKEEVMATKKSVRKPKLKQKLVRKGMPKKLAERIANRPPKGKKKA